MFQIVEHIPEALQFSKVTTHRHATTSDGVTISRISKILKMLRLRFEDALEPKQFANLSCEPLGSLLTA